MWVKDNVPGLPARLKGASKSRIYTIISWQVECQNQSATVPYSGQFAGWGHHEGRVRQVGGGRVEMRRVSFSSLNDFRSYRLRQKFRSFAPHRVIYPENTRHPRRSKSRTLLFSIESVLCPSGVTPVGCKRPGWTSGRPYTSPLTHPTCDDNPICLLRMGDAH